MSEKSAAGAPRRTDPVRDSAAPAPQPTGKRQRRKLARLQQVDVPTIDTLEELGGSRESLHRVRTPVSHLQSTASTRPPRRAAGAYSALMTERGLCAPPGGRPVTA